jgi:hypothetical protein
MQPTSSGGLRHPDASEFSEHPIKEVPEVSLKPLGLLGLNRGRLRGRVLKLEIVCNDAMRRAFSSFFNGYSGANKNRVRGIA